MSVETKYGETILKQTQELADMFKQAMPKVTMNKNGYEIRTQVLEMAKDNVWSDFHAKFAGWEQTVKRDPESGEVVTTVSMPEVPGVDAVLEAADKFYDFVNGKTNK
jgi:hypothetical protein